MFVEGLALFCAMKSRESFILTLSESRESVSLWNLYGEEPRDQLNTPILPSFQNMTESEVSAFELTSLQETVDEIRDRLHTSNRLPFENNVEVHLSHIMSAVSQMGTLHAFDSS